MSGAYQRGGFGVTHVQDEDEEVSLLALTSKLLLSFLDILLQLTHSVLQGGTGVIDLVHDQDVLADQVGHLQRAQVQPLCASHLGARDFLGIAATKVFVKRQTDGLDGDVGVAGALKEGSRESRVSYAVARGVQLATWQGDDLS